MTDLKKKKTEKKINDSCSKEIVLSNGELIFNSTTSDDNTICTRETESSILTILKSSGKEYMFDDRIKLYNKEKNLKQKKNRMDINKKSSVKKSNFYHQNYKLFKNIIFIIGITLFLCSVIAILFLMLLPKITEHYIKNSTFEIREIDILQISRHNGDTSFEINAILETKDISKYKTEFVHSLINISYSILSETKDRNLLGELYISQISKDNGHILARGRFTIKNNESMKILMKHVASKLGNIENSSNNEQEIAFYGKGLMSLKVFGILLNNISVEKTLNSFSIYDIIGTNKRNSNKDSKFYYDSQTDVPNIYSGIKIHNKWFNTYNKKGIRINFELEIDLKDVFNASNAKILIPKFVMGNIGNLKFDVFLENEKICEVVWFDVNFKSGNNIWNLSIDFPEYIPEKLKELIINVILEENEISNKYLVIKGNLSENEAFNDVFKNFQMELPLIVILNIIESEIKGIKLNNSNGNNFRKLVRFIRLYNVHLLKEKEDLTIVGNIKLGYINPLGNNLPILLNGLTLKSSIFDQLNQNYGILTLKLVEKEMKPEPRMRLLYEDRLNNVNSAIINLNENNIRMLPQRRVPRSNSKHENYINDPSQAGKNKTKLNKCTNTNIIEINQPITLNPCYNIQELDMELSVNIDNLNSNFKNKWLQNMIYNHENLVLSESTISANITSIFGNSEFNNIKINRNLLEDKNKLQILNSYESELDDDDYDFEDYYKDETSAQDENIEAFNMKNHTNFIDVNEISILGEGYNNSWIIKVEINKEALSNLGLTHLDIGSFGILMNFENSSLGFIGTENFKVEDKSDLLLFGVIKPETEPGTDEINHLLTEFIKSIITGDQNEIQNRNFTLEFKTDDDGKEKCIQYFNYSNYISQKEVDLWLDNKELPQVVPLKKKFEKKKNWLEKLLNGQRIDIPMSTLKQLSNFNVQKLFDKTIESSSTLIKNSLCRVQSIFNQDIVFENSVDSDRDKIKEILSNKFKEKNIKLSNIIFQIMMFKRESDLMIPIQGMFDLSIPNIISKQIFMDILFIDYGMEIYDKDRKKKILAFKHLQNFNDLDNEKDLRKLSKLKKTDNFDLNFRFENSIVELEDDSDQLMNTIKSIFAIPKFSNEQVSKIEIKNSIGIGIKSSMGILKLNDLNFLSTIEIPRCAKSTIKDSNNKNVNSIFKVESIQIQKIRLILPPRGIDVQINTTINIPNYIENIVLDVIIGQCVFELKNQEDNLLAIVKTPKQIIIGNNRKTESVCHGFVPAKSWLPIMNLLANEEKKDEKLHIKAINTSHGIPYWLLPVFDYYKLLVSNTLSGLDATEFGSVSFS